VKYEVLGLGTPAAAPHGMERTCEAIVVPRTAVALARAVGDPALFLRAASGPRALDGDDALAGEERVIRTRIACGLRDARMPEALASSEWALFR
jgi:hypothetical protein